MNLRELGCAEEQKTVRSAVQAEWILKELVKPGRLAREAKTDDLIDLLKCQEEYLAIKYRSNGRSAGRRNHGEKPHPLKSKRDAAPGSCVILFCRSVHRVRWGAYEKPRILLLLVA